MTIYKDVKVAVEKYIGKDGKEKNKYHNVGVAIIHSDGRMSIKLDKTFNPAGVSGDCWLNLFDKMENKNNNDSPF